jgi:prepilin-type N-terminal cleavage/methylation domain-containing protein
MNTKKKGFTLIELLVVVLIIGILAAIALPQYQKAVAKARAAEAITLIRPFKEAIERYYLVHGHYPEASAYSEINDLLDIQIPTGGTNKLVPYYYKGIYVSVRFSYKGREIVISSILDHATEFTNIRGIACAPNTIAYTEQEKSLCTSICGNDTFKVMWLSGQSGCLIGRSDWN